MLPLQSDYRSAAQSRIDESAVKEKAEAKDARKATKQQAPASIEEIDRTQLKRLCLVGC